MRHRCRTSRGAPFRTPARTVRTSPITPRSATVANMKNTTYGMPPFVPPGLVSAWTPNVTHVARSAIAISIAAISTPAKRYGRWPNGDQRGGHEIDRQHATNHALVLRIERGHYRARQCHDQDRKHEQHPALAMQCGPLCCRERDEAEDQRKPAGDYV